MDTAKTLLGVLANIHKFCLDCCEIKNEDTETCKNLACKLYKYRNGASDFESRVKENEKKRRLIEKWK